MVFLNHLLIGRFVDNESWYRLLNDAEEVFLYEGYNYIKPLRTKSYSFGFWARLRLFLYCVFFRSHYESVGVESKGVLFFFGSYARKQRNSSVIVERFSMAIGGGMNGSVYEISDVFDYLFIKKIFKLFFLKRKYSDFGFFNSCVLSLMVVRAHSDSIRIQEQFGDFGLNNVITFCDAIGSESLIAQIAKRNGCMTYTNQHGQYRNLAKGLFSQDIEAFNGFVSNYMLVWGEATVQEFSDFGVDTKRLIITGSLDRDFSVLKSNKSYINFKSTSRVGVALSGPNSLGYNIKTLKFCDALAQKYDFQYVVRLHPKDKEINYKEHLGRKGRFYKEVIDGDYFCAAEFSIIGMTGFYLDCICNNHPFLFFDDGNISDVFKRSNCFVNADSLLDSVIEIDFSYLSGLYNDTRNQSLIVEKLVLNEHVI